MFDNRFDISAMFKFSSVCTGALDPWCNYPWSGELHQTGDLNGGCCTRDLSKQTCLLQNQVKKSKMTQTLLDLNKNLRIKNKK